MNNAPIRVVAVDYEPFVVSYNNTVIGGIDYNILVQTAKILNFSFTIDLITSWDDANFAVRNGFYDISIGGHWQLLVIKYGYSTSTAYGHTCLSLLVNKPKLLPQETYVFQPFPSYLWIILFALTLVMSTILTVLHKIFDRIHTSFTSNLLYSFQALTLSGGVSKLFKYHPRSIATIKILWSFLALLVYTFYSSGFASILTSPKYTKNINTIDDVIKQNLMYVSISRD